MCRAAESFLQIIMSRTFKQKVHHILYNKDGKPNLRIPLKQRWSYINKVRRNNYDRDEDRRLLLKHRDKISRTDMKQQIKEL